MASIVLFWTLVISILIPIIWFLVWFIVRFVVYKHNVIVKEVVEGRKVITQEKARDYTDSDGVSWWRLYKEKNKLMRNIPIPPPESIELNKKGKKCVEFYRTETGEVIFISDKTTDPAKMVVDLQPLSTKQRLILIDNIKKAHIRKKHSWKENIPIYVSIGALVVLVLGLMVFWGDIAKPVIEANNQQLAIQTQQTEQLKILRDIKHGVQTIEGNLENIDARVTELEKPPPN